MHALIHVRHVYACLNDASEQMNVNEVRCAGMQIYGRLTKSSLRAEQILTNCKILWAGALLIFIYIMKKNAAMLQS